MSTGIAQKCVLSDGQFASSWTAIKVPESVKTRLLAHAMLCLTVRRVLTFDVAPLHGLIVLAGPPGTGKTTLARGLAGRVAAMLKAEAVTFLQIDPHGLASAALGKTQQQVTALFQQTIPEAGLDGPAVVLLDEVEALAADRRRMSLEANPVDVHRATDAVLSGLDLLTQQHKHILLVATTNYPEAVDPAFLSRADLVEMMPLPNAEARKQIIIDTLENLAIHWPNIGKLMSEVQGFVEASRGLDGRRLRKAVVGAAAQSIDSARDLNKITTKHVLAAIQAAVHSQTEAGHEIT